MEVAMYKQFYGMSSNPFDKNLDTKNAYMTQDMRAIQGRLTHLKEHPELVFLQLEQVREKPLHFVTLQNN